MTTFHKTLADAHAARQVMWDPNGVLDSLFYSNEMGGECGEAQNKVKKLVRERLGLPGSRATLAELAEELADVIITATVVAWSEGIDLRPQIINKFNSVSAKLEFDCFLDPDAKELI